MLENKKAESFVGIIVWVFILSFVMLGIINILIFSTDVTTKYNEANRVQILRQNLTNVIKNIDTSMLSENEIFYIHKNRAASNHEIYTWSLNERFKYVDEVWDTVPDVNNFDGDVYSQILWVSNEDITFLEENQVIRASIKKLIKSN